MTLPLTGEQYLDSLRDGPAVFIDGERVDEVTAHPASTFSPSPSPRGRLDEMRDLVARCMAEYDLDGWVEGPWV